MKAATYSATGSALDVLRVAQVDRPEPGPGEVLVRVHASGVNPTDFKARSGATPRVRACVTANVTLRFVLLYGVPDPALDTAAADITAAVAAGALTELPVLRFPLTEVAAAHEACEGGAVGKVIVAP